MSLVVLHALFTFTLSILFPPRQILKLRERSSDTQWQRGNGQRDRDKCLYTFFRLQIHLTLSMLWHTVWQHAYILGLFCWINYLVYIIEMDRGILPLPLADGGKDTVRWRRAQLSALINHTGHPTLPSYHSSAPRSRTCRHLQLKHTGNCKGRKKIMFPDFHMNSNNNTYVCVLFLSTK